jgi:hypothetical protein
VSALVLGAIGVGLVPGRRAAQRIHVCVPVESYAAAPLGHGRDQAAASIRRRRSITGANRSISRTVK